MSNALWKNRGFILGSVKREFQSKYKNSLLGTCWSVIHPIAMVIVYTVIFSEVMHARLVGYSNQFGYSIYLCVGILTWGLFTEIVNKCINIFIENANLLKKINFPRLCLPIISILNALVNFGIIFGIFLVFLIISNNFPGVAIIAIIPLLLLLILFATGLGVTLGILNVFFRDVGQFFSIFMTFWFWFTPIVYPISILKEKLPWLVGLNPITPLILALQDIFISKEFPEVTTLFPLIIITALLCYSGLVLYRRRSGEMVDEL